MTELWLSLPFSVMLMLVLICVVDQFCDVLLCLARLSYTANFIAEEQHTATFAKPRNNSATKYTSLPMTHSLTGSSGSKTDPQPLFAGGYTLGEPGPHLTQCRLGRGLPPGDLRKIHMTLLTRAQQ